MSYTWVGAIILLVIFICVVLAVVARGWRKRMKQRGAIQSSVVGQPPPAAGSQVAEPDAALATLRKRFVNGDITGQEYEQIRRVLMDE
jgi:uncharacterized membrane protein